MEEKHTYAVGQKVRIIDNTGFHGFEHGEIVEIIELMFDEYENYYEAKGENGKEWYIADEEIELIKE